MGFVFVTTCKWSLSFIRQLLCVRHCTWFGYLRVTFTTALILVLQGGARDHNRGQTARKWGLSSEARQTPELLFSTPSFTPSTGRMS